MNVLIIMSSIHTGAVYARSLNNRHWRIRDKQILNNNIKEKSEEEEEKKRDDNERHLSLYSFSFFFVLSLCSNTFEDFILMN